MNIMDDVLTVHLAMSEGTTDDDNSSMKQQSMARAMLNNEII